AIIRGPRPRAPRRAVGRARAPPSDVVGDASWFESEDALPVLLHADDGPALLLGLVVEGLGERADLAGGETGSRSVRVLARRIVVQHQHHESCSVARARVLEHLTVPGGIAKGRVGPPADHQVNPLGLPGVVVVEEEPGLLGEEGPAALVVAV